MVVYPSDSLASCIFVLSVFTSQTVQ